MSERCQDQPTAEARVEVVCQAPAGLRNETLPQGGARSGLLEGVALARHGPAVENAPSNHPGRDRSARFKSVRGDSLGPTRPLVESVGPRLMGGAHPASRDGLARARLSPRGEPRPWLQPHQCSSTTRKTRRPRFGPSPGSWPATPAAPERRTPQGLDRDDLLHEPAIARVATAVRRRWRRGFLWWHPSAASGDEAALAPAMVRALTAWWSAVDRSGWATGPPLRHRRHHRSVTRRQMSWWSRAAWTAA